jgi:hypothetical protein
MYVCLYAYLDSEDLRGLKGAWSWRIRRMYVCVCTYVGWVEASMHV